MNITLYRNPTRALTTWAPFYRPMGLLDEMEELARELWGSWRPGLLGGVLMPHADIYEEKGELVVKTELPGVTEKDLEVTLEGDTLTIKAEKREEVSEEATHHTQERHYGRYVRSMSLPFHVDGEKISATFDHGVLELRLPRVEEIEPRRIEVKTTPAPRAKKTRQRKSK